MAPPRPEPVTDEQLEQVQDLEHLGALLRQAMDRAVLSIRRLESAAEASERGLPPEVRVKLTRTKIGDMLKGRSITDPHLRLAVKLCGVPEAQIAKWLRAYYRVSGQPVLVDDGPPGKVGKWGFLRKTRVQVGLALFSVVAVAAVYGVFAWHRTTNDSASKIPFTVQASTVVHGWCTTLVFDKMLSELSPPPTVGYEQWAWDHDGIEATRGLPDSGSVNKAGRVQLSLRGTSAVPVTITGLDVEIVERKPGPLRGIVVSGLCGSETVGRLAEIDLDAHPPKIVRSNADPTQIWGQDTDTKPLKFPYLISATDPELLLVVVELNNSDTVSYRLHVGWTDGVHAGTQVIDHGGKPFRVGFVDVKNQGYYPSDIK